MRPDRYPSTSSVISSHNLKIKKKKGRVTFTVTKTTEVEIPGFLKNNSKFIS